MQTDFGGAGGNLTDMKYIRLKIKALQVHDVDTQQHLQHGFQMNVTLPLPDIYQKCVSNQLIKLSNYTQEGVGAFCFNNMNLYNFRINESTFAQLSDAILEVQVEGTSISGSIKMGKLLLAPKFQLKTQIEVFKTTELHKETDSVQVGNQKGGKGAKGAKKKDDAHADHHRQTIREQCGLLEIELNLQMGDTEEELMRNYKMKLDQQEDYRKKKEEIELMERRKRAVMQMEAQPTFAQLYLHVDKIGNEGISVPRANQAVVPGQPLAPRNLYITYKSFPTLEKMTTGVQYN